MRLGRKRPLRGWFGRLRPTVQRRLKIAVPYSLMGLAALVGSFFYSEMPDWGYWLPFAALFVLLEFFAVEVNDRMLQSSSVMVAMTAGVILAVLPDSDAMFGLALMAALASCSLRATSRRSGGSNRWPTSGRSSPPAPLPDSSSTRIWTVWQSKPAR